MPFQLSPGVNTSEIDLTTIVPTVSTTVGAIAGVFSKGPAFERVLIDSESTLVDIFGGPTANNYETWFTAANFLNYSNSLYVVRVLPDGANNAYAGNSSVVAGPSILNRHDFEMQSAGFATNQVGVFYSARHPGALGNSMKVSVCDSVNAYSSTIDLTDAHLKIEVGASYANLTGTNAVTAAGLIVNGDYLFVGNSSIGTQYIQVANVVTDGASGKVINFTEPYKLSSNTDLSGGSVMRYWEFYNIVTGAPTTSDFVSNFGNTAAVDTMHIVVTDQDGKITGVPGAILESYQGLSRATDAKTVGGQTNYYKTVIDQSSQYIWVLNDRPGSASANAYNVASSTVAGHIPFSASFIGGTTVNNEDDIGLPALAKGYSMFNSSEDVAISFVLQGKPYGGTTPSGEYTANNFQLANWLIDNIAEVRKDCVVFVTPDDGIVLDNQTNEAPALVAWRNVLRSTSYAVLDSGYKYQYDRYNDVYRYVPTNGDVAGLCARTDQLRDPWWSPAGFNRGQLKNVVRMRWNPKQTERDLIYSNGINPVLSIPGEGIVLYGDKTLQTKPSAFDRINVRRLFILLEKSISTAAKYSLFEFNDEFTRTQFKNLVVPYLREVKARRGISDFLVVCDATNNTPERIDRNEFWGDIYIKPARSINFIQLNFVAVATGVQFSEVVGKF
jgi:phage tail sheath protein FI